MPANVVHSAEQERLWEKAKAQAEEQGRAKDWQYIMGIFKRMGGLEKSYVVPSRFRASTVPGQVPSRERLAAMREQRDLEQMPRRPDLVQLLQNTDPMGSASSVVRGLGFDARASGSWERFLEKAAASAPNELVLRQAVVAQAREDHLQPELRQAILERALSFWRTMRKSMVQVVTVDELKKAGPYANAGMQKASPPETWTVEIDCSPAGAQSLVKLIGKVKQLGNPGHSFGIVLDPDNAKEQAGWDGDGPERIFEIRTRKSQPFQKSDPRGGAYHRRVPQEGGGYRYIYDPEKYQARSDAHVDGREARKAYLHSRIAREVEGCGLDGCDPQMVLEKFSGKFSAEEIKEAFKSGCGGKLEFKKGRFYVRAGATEATAKSVQGKFCIRR